MLSQAQGEPTVSVVIPAFDAEFLTRDDCLGAGPDLERLAPAGGR